MLHTEPLVAISNASTLFFMRKYIWQKEIFGCCEVDDNRRFTSEISCHTHTHTHALTLLQLFTSSYFFIC
jgi:hypothetical protein